MNKLNIKISLVILIYGIFFNNPFLANHPEKAILGIALYSIPLIVNLLKKSNEVARIYSIWFGIFMIIQSIILGFIFGSNYITLSKNLNKEVLVKNGVLSGITGVQKIITDEKGYRVTKKIDYQNKELNKFRIFVIGGSTTEQIYLDQKNTWTHLLQEKLDKNLKNKDFEVINTGVSGLRAINHVETLKKIIKYNPDMVMFLIGINDWNHHINHNYKSDHQQFIEGSFRIFNQFSYNETLRKAFRKIGDKFDKNKNKDQSQNKELTKTYFESGSLNKEDKRDLFLQDVLTSYKKELERMVNICNKHSLKCIFIDQPNGYKESSKKDYRDTFWMTPPAEKYTLTFESMSHISNLYNNYLKDFAKKNNAGFCELNNKIPASLDFMYDDCHFNKAGAKRVSEVLFDCLSKNYIKNNN